MVQEGASIKILNAFAKIQNNFIKIELDKWASVKVSEEVLIHYHSG